MSKLPSMPFFPADFFADTEHLSPSARHAYLFLLCHAWLRGAKLPNDDHALARLAGFRLDIWRKLKPHVMEFWKLDHDGNLVNKRQLVNFETVHTTREINKANGARGGYAKALNSKNTYIANGTFKTSEALGNQNHNQILKDSFNGELRQESRWVPTKRIGSRLFKVGELAPAYDGQPVRSWKTLKPEDCQ